MQSAVVFDRIGKRFGAIQANRDVSFSIRAGSIHGVIGENGAGKSTLMSMLYGLLPPDSGTIQLFGQNIRFHSPADAIAAGIGMVPQHFHLVEPMTALDNIILGAEGGFSLDRAKRRARLSLHEITERYGLHVDLDAVIADLPIGVRQRVEILKALYRGAEILILDEPTAVLTPDEVGQFFANLRRLRDEGKTILIISHKLREIMAIADHVTVLRAGQVVGDLPAAETDEAGLATLMIGRAPERLPNAASNLGNIILSARNLTVRDNHGIARLNHIDLDLREGEITGVAGVAGNGQTELLDALSGLIPASGELIWFGESVPQRDRARQLRRLGLGHIPEDRLAMGLVTDFDLWESGILGIAGEEPQATSGMLNVGKIFADTRKRLTDWNIKPPNPRLKTGNLSGGNQQKLVASREIGRAPKVLLVGQPTRGVDIGAIELIHRRLIALKTAGCAILLISSELDEILALADRILVMSAGRITGALTRDQADETSLGLLMAGSAPHHAA